MTPGPLGNDAYLLSRSLTGDANSEDWATVFSHFPREHSITLHFRNDTAFSDSLYLLSDGSVPLIEVQLQRTDDDEADLVVQFPGVTVTQPVSIANDDEFHTIVLKLEGDFLSIYVDCRFESFLKLKSTPENITVIADTRFTLFGTGYVVRKSYTLAQYTYVLQLSASL